MTEEKSSPYEEFDHNHNDIMGPPFDPVHGLPPSECEKKTLDDDDDLEDMDLLIEELESVRGVNIDEEELLDESGSDHATSLPESLLGTDPERGLPDAEVLTRRKRFGLNKMKEEKENNLLKFLSFFVGPIQFVMEVSKLWTCVLVDLGPELKLI